MHNGEDAEYFPSIPVGLCTTWGLLLKKGDQKKEILVKFGDVVSEQERLWHCRGTCLAPRDAAGPAATWTDHVLGPKAELFSA